MLYKKNSEKSLSKELFQNPTSEYRGTPFWAWNNYLTKEELERQIDIFKEMGLGGFHMHVRTGLKNQYLSDSYMELVDDCVKKAKKEEMLAWLYDEDRWPSGAAGGLVTCDEKYRARSLLFTPFRYGEGYDSEDASAQATRSGKGSLLACYDIVLDDNGFLKSYRRINEDDEAEGKKWYALLEISTNNNWYNGQAYADTLSKEAIDRFIEVTHEKYKEKVGYEFDGTVPAIFTDEPQFTRKQVLNNSFDEMDISLPWTDKVPELYKEAYGADIYDTLPELFWDLPASEASIHRYRYHDFIAELFAKSFADNVGSWCRENKIALTGHMMEEPTLRSQCAALGEAMRSYRGFDIPGIDMLCNRAEFTTAKQAQSAVHQFGYEGMLSELYGVTGWDCDFRTYKYQGDWQAALGVTVRVPHLSWYAMGGEAKRDYPASIHYQSPWYKKYPLIENHFARVNTALTRGKPVIKVAVVHPIESFWLHWGPNDKSALLRESLDERFENLTNWLLTGSVDFNFISESLLPDLCEKGSAPLKVGKMEYDAVIVPGCETLRSTTIERLADFKADGGKLIFMGDAPYLCDALPSDKCKKLYDESIKTDFSRAAILNALEDNRTVTLRFANGRLSDDLLYQLRQDDDCKWLFVCHTEEPDNKDVHRGDYVRITVEGEYIAELYDTFDGTIKPMPATYRNGKTMIDRQVYAYDSLLIKLTDGKAENGKAKEWCEVPEGKQVESVVPYALSEKNILLLDIAEFKLGGETEFSPEEEVLRLDNVCRERLGIVKRGGSIVQPWVTGEVPTVDKLTLRFTFDSEIDYSGAEFAFEEADKVEKIIFNGKEVEKNILGNYVDISIFKIALPQIVKGKNTLEITYLYGEKVDIENMFILGDFGVKFNGNKKTVIALPEKVGFGDLVPQGFPFYSGNITYKFKGKATNGKMNIRATWYRGAAISVKVDGEEKGDIIYPPYILTVDGLADGEHEVEMTLYIHRYNSFGPVHLVDEKESWHGPGAWRSTGRCWTYEYVLRRTGILAAPAIIEE
ncbi:MAG: hypothetical protein MJ147_05625 [Clostridia bacterium]|nr:hypothetical protein [Clostridia bacterium]